MIHVENSQSDGTRFQLVKKHQNLEQGQLAPANSTPKTDKTPMEVDNTCAVIYASDYLDLAESETRPDDAVRYIYKHNPLPNVSCHCCEQTDDSSVEACKILDGINRQLDHDSIKQIVAENRVKFSTGRRVAIIGSGAAALTTAFDLVSKGHCVVVYEADRQPGGIMRDMASQDGLSSERLDDDIDIILSLGIDLRVNMKIGKQITLDKLNTNFDAVLDTTDMFAADKGQHEIRMPEWMWTAKEMQQPREMYDAISAGHETADSMHEALMTMMWKQA